MAKVDHEVQPDVRVVVTVGLREWKTRQGIGGWVMRLGARVMRLGARIACLELKFRDVDDGPKSRHSQAMFSVN